VPAGSVITSFVDFLITLGLMALMMIWFGFLPDWRLLTLPFFIVLALPLPLVLVFGYRHLTSNIEIFAT
jgi:ABC-type polysaccharide/polyol phosphate export permease